MNQVVDAGHEIALHGVDHVRLTTLPSHEVRNRLRSGRERLEDAVQREVRWFRPPYGAQTPLTWWAARRIGLQPVVWNCAAYDWQDVPPTAIAERVLAGVSSGAVVLLHDGHAGVIDGVD